MVRFCCTYGNRLIDVTTLDVSISEENHSVYFVWFPAAGVVQKSYPGLHGRRLWGHRGLHGQRALQVYPTFLIYFLRIGKKYRRNNWTLSRNSASVSMSTVDSNPGIPQKSKMGHISKGVANSL